MAELTLEERIREHVRSQVFCSWLAKEGGETLNVDLVNYFVSHFDWAFRKDGVSLREPLGDALIKFFPPEVLQALETLYDWMSEHGEEATGKVIEFLGEAAEAGIRLRELSTPVEEPQPPAPSLK